MAKSNPDPLEGYRPRSQDATGAEQLSAALRGLTESGIDYDEIRFVMVAGELEKALREDTLMARLVEHCVQIIRVNTYEWTESNDPTSDENRERHLEARAARIVIGWVESVIQTGDVAQKQIEETEAVDDQTTDTDTG